ncbi:TerC family protein [Clostridium coskatii]|uniref:Integral membrane protein TerC family protein n=1 Tax=Clostridium coskatii TaxID=1705578 RepID=A0A166TNX8_9CLOT|nr:TerC family protein [Clostridium coskatii]OAA93920.1 Integral membrane protein TerC family protein [Clostridium coskatii]OBR95249.1 integral membrane protein TerC family protein [Clostridium coskatii]
MDNLTTFLLGALQITLLDIVLSGDNIGVIALATKDLPKKHAKSASMIGVFAAIFLRIIFACLITYIMLIEWLPIKLIGGILLIKITWNFISPKSEKENLKISPSNKYFRAISSIVIADATMSLDNVLAIAAAAHGHVPSIIFGLVLNIPIIFLGSQFVAKLMNKHPMVIYLGGAVLAHTSLNMMLEDKILAGFTSPVLTNIVSFGFAIIVLVYGLYRVNKPVSYSFKKFKEDYFKSNS